MRYFKKYREEYADLMGGPRKMEISKDEARGLLDGCHNPYVLDDIFRNDKPFRLWAQFVEIWTENDGMVPMAGFYGTVGN